MTEKILSYATAPAVLQSLKNKGTNIVQCHGTFDLVHPGHIHHLQEAKKLGDVLVVTITADAHVNKGPNRPCFNEVLRAESLAALSCVDYVVIMPFPAAVEAIDCVKPNVYCKGKEYENPKNDVTGNIAADIIAVESHGGEIAYIGDIVFSSTKLLNNQLNHLPAEIREFCHSLSKKHSSSDLKDFIESLSGMKVVVIGDTIFDRYTNVAVQGLTSKNKILSGHFLHEQTYNGGALAAFRHVRAFCDNVKYVSLLGAETEVYARMEEVLTDEENHCIISPGFTTPLKKRYVQPGNPGNELIKLFSVNYIHREEISEEVQDQVCERILSSTKGADLVLLLDFGHGMMTPRVRETIQGLHNFLAINCQSNSHNHGFNILPKQYVRANAFSLDNTEMQLACGERSFDPYCQLESLKTKLGAEHAWLTRGNVFTIGLKSGEDPVSISPMEKRIIDTIGAGDAFFSLAALAAAKGASAEVATFLGQIAGAQAVRIPGNEAPISKPSTLRAIESLLNF